MDASAFAKEPRGNHAGIVEDQKLIAAKEVGQLRKICVGYSAGGASEQKQPCGVAFGKRALRDLRCRQEVVEIVSAHVRASVAYPDAATGEPHYSSSFDGPGLWRT